MKAYILSVIGATLISALTGILSPEKWRKYIGVITGLVIISCIISPIASISHTELFRGFDEVEQASEYSDELQTSMVKEELERRVSEDIEKRILDEFHLTVSADCDINITENKEISGVETVYIRGAKLSEKARQRLREIYGLEEDAIVYK